MKKIFLLPVVCLAFFSCKQQSPDGAQLLFFLLIRLPAFIILESRHFER